jgi:carbon monoxide dehydrogenase subunit G
MRLGRSLLLGAFAALSLSPVSLRAQDGFGADERRHLDAGELVERPSRTERGGRRYVGGTSYRVVERPLEEVWRALHDFEHYEHMLPNTHESTVVEPHRNGAVLRIGHSYGPVSAHYHLHVTFEERQHRVDFDLDETRPHDIDAAHGFCEVSAYEGGRTLVTWAARVDPGSSFFLEPLRPEIQRWLLRVPSTMRTYLVEGSGRDRYRD